MFSIKKILSLIAIVCSPLICLAAAPIVSARGTSDFICTKLEKINLTTGKHYYVISEDKPQCKAAKESLTAASVIVTGEASPKLLDWALAISKDPDYAAKFNEGLGFGDAVKWLKARIAASAEDRSLTIENVFREVYGRDSTPGELAYWDAQVKTQKSWYAPMVLQETGKLNSNPENRLPLIQNVFGLTFGREPNAAEIAKWKARKEGFRLMMDANRNYLWSADGSQELLDTLIRAFKTNNHGAVPQDYELKPMVTSYADKKFIYVEMLVK